MIKDLIVSFKDNFKDKVKNPFLGTYILVWLFRNWDLIFTLFNFDKGLKLNKKIELINSYFITNPFLKGVLINIALTFLVLVITYILLNISRGIVNMFEKQLKPIVYKMTDKSSIVLKEDFENLKAERDDLLLRISEERDSRSKIELKLKEFQNEIKEDNISLDQSYQNTVKEENEKNEVLRRDFLDKKILNDFYRIALKIKKNKFIRKDDDTVDPFIEKNLIEFDKDNLVSNLYKLTNFGSKFYKYISKHK